MATKETENISMNIDVILKNANITESQIKTLTKQIDKLNQEAKKFEVGSSKRSNLETRIKELKSFRDLLKSTFVGVKQGSASITDITKQFQNLGQTLPKVSANLKEISRSMASIRTSTAGINALNLKSWYAGRKDNQRFGTKLGISVEEAKLQAQPFLQQKELAKYQKIISDGLNPALAEETKKQAELNKQQEAFNRRLEYTSKVLPMVQLRIMANYAAINKVVSGFKYLLNYTVQYDEALHQLQAISATSTGSLKQMQKAIEDVAASTEFTSLELSKASVILAQAGLSATQIQGTLPAIAKLATATGTDLNTSVETITSTLNIYNLQTSEAEHVTNALTTAMNESKANIGGFQQAIQYAGNLAAQLGISFDETAAAISAAAQAGIRSKSMLGTGMRATLTELLKPTKKFKAQLASVGLTIEDVDVKSKGYVNVLKTLKEAGFGAEEAFRGLDRRAAAFLVTQINQVDFMQNLRQEMASSTAASKANEVQMESLAKQYRTFQNNVANAMTNGLEPFIRMLSDLLSVLNQLLKNEALKSILGSIFTGVGAFAGVKALGMIVQAWKSIGEAFKGISSSKITALTGLFSFKSPQVALIVAAVTAIISLGNSFINLTSDLEKTKKALEDVSGEYEEVRNKVSGVKDVLQKVYDQREKLQDQSERDIFVSEILSKYPEISSYINKVTLSYKELIDVVKQLNALTTAEEAAKAAEKAELMRKAEKGLVKEAGKEVTLSGLNSFLQNSSFSQLREAASRYNPQNYSSSTEFIKATGGSRGISLYLRELIKEILEDAKAKGTKEFELTIAALKNEAIKSGDKGLKDIVKIISDEAKQSLEASNKAMQSASENIAIEIKKTSKAYEEHTKSMDEARSAIDEFKQETKLGTENVNDLIEIYNKLKDKQAEMADLIDLSTGKKLDYGTYSLEQAAMKAGFGTDTKAFEDALNKYISEQKKSDEDDKRSRADFQREFLEANSYGNDLLFDIGNITSEIAKLIAMKEEGKAFLEGQSSLYYLNQAKSSISKAKNWNKKSRDSSKQGVQENLTKYLRSSLSGIAPNGRKITNDFDLYSNGNIAKRSDIESKIDTILSKNYGYSGELLAKKKDQMRGVLNNIYSEQDKLVSKLSDTAKAAGPKFDTAAASLNKFFKDLEADINKVEIAYSEAEKALDSVLAKQQGRITATGLIFGKSSGIVQYEQNRLESMQDAQIPDRLANLRAELLGYQRIRASLESNPNYMDITSRYQAAESRYDTAIAKGNWNEAREANRIMKELASANKKYTDEEKKLTTKITDLEKQIDELNTTIKDEEALSKMSATEQLGLGWRAATSNYVKENKDKGITNLAGAMSELSTQGINTLDSAMTTMFQNIADGSKKAGDAFKDFGKSVIQTLRDVAIQMAVKQGLTALFGGLMGSSEPINLLGQTSWFGNNAQGGLIKGPVKNRDSVPTMLMPGEYVMKKSAVDTLGRDYLDSLNSNASAALYNASESISDSKSSTSADEATGAGGIVNVYVVGQEQQQSMTPNDVLVTITQDMLKGGQTKKLVKSIAMGSL